MSTPAAVVHPPAVIPDRRLLLILSALMSFGSLSVDIYLPALPTIGRELHADTATLNLTLSTFLIGFSLGQLLWGPISDRVGRRLPIAIGLVLFAAGSIGCAMAGTIEHLLVWRAIQALGACAAPVLARAMVRDLYAREHAARMLSTLILVMAIAPLIGPIVGGQILLHASWRAIFWMLAVLGMLATAALVLLPETLPPSRRAVEPLSHTLKGYALCARDPALLGYAVSGGFFYAGVSAFVVGSPFAYIEYYGVSAQGYGWLFAINIAGMMVANSLNAKLMSRFGSARLFRAGVRILAFSGVWLILESHFGWGGLPGLVVPIVVFMSMNGLIVANSVAGALAGFPERAGTASSFLGALHFGSGIVSAWVVGALSTGTPSAMAWVMGVSGMASLAAAMIARRRVRALESALAADATGRGARLPS
ncbi:Bcr/CflA family multidrug efflux MFS transporter [soil metagenome]